MPEFIPIFATKISATKQNYPTYLKSSLSDTTVNIAEEDTVFIFPGNTGHNSQPHQNLYTIKSGGGLARVSNDLGARGLATLSLPTTGMNQLSKSKQQAIAARAIEDVWFAIGAGFSIALPVRQIQEGGSSYFSEELFSNDEGSYEPSFWGGIESSSNKELGDFYLNQLKQIKNYLDMPGLLQVPREFQPAHTAGQSADKADKTSLTYKAKQKRSSVKSYIKKPKASQSRGKQPTVTELDSLSEDIESLFTYLNRPPFNEKNAAAIISLGAERDYFRKHLSCYRPDPSGEGNITNALRRMSKKMIELKQLDDLPQANLIDRILACINRLMHMLTSNSQYHFFEAHRERCDFTDTFHSVQQRTLVN